MINRKELKKRAKKSIKNQYFKGVLICFVFTIIFGGGYTFVTERLTPPTAVIESNVSVDTITKPGSIKENIEEELETKEKAYLENTKYTRGVLSIFANQITASGSVIFGVLNAVNHLAFQGSVSVFIVLLIGVVFNFVLAIFIKNILMVGKCRFFLENRRFKKTNLDRLLLVYRVKRTINVALGMLRVTIYQFLWNLTIIGGIIKHYSYRLVPYILAENPSIKSKEAVELSRAMMNGHKFYLFKLDMSLILWYILGIITFQFTDILFLNPYYETILAEFYMNARSLAKKNKITNYKLLNDDDLEGEVVDGVYPSKDFSIPEKDHRKWLKIDYKKNYSLMTFILFFFTFAIVGWVWEVMLHLFSDGVFVNRGTLYGPWLPIYGWGGVMILALLKPFRDKPWLTFILALMLCGIVEYSTAWYLETFKHMRWWDYSGYFLNLDGRICLEGLLVFGLGGCGFTYFLAPVLDNIYKKIPNKIKIIICVILLSFFIVDNINSHFHPNSGKGITDYQPKEQIAFVNKEKIAYNNI